MQELVEAATKLRDANARFDAAEAALRANHFAKALSEARAGLELAPSARGYTLESQARSAQLGAERQATLEAQEAALLRRADSSFLEGEYFSARADYKRALLMRPRDPGPAEAGWARARAAWMAEAREAVRHKQPATCAGRPFLFGKTAARGGDGQVPMRGELGFTLEPPVLKAGDSFSMVIVLLNEGTAPIPIQSLSHNDTVDGKKFEGDSMLVGPQVVEPGDAEPLLTLGMNCHEKPWSMEVTVRTSPGASYTNIIELR